ncbi:MAG TPA: shikimate dehydrogenase [Vicinamibacteria bacterium]|nr:shikimate dehydrogenase [Vicinamibacteria bacterium]
MTQICVSLTEETTERTIDRMVDLAPVADLFEIRGDLVLDLDLLTLLRAKTKPLVFTCRPVAEGGRFDGDVARRRALLLEAAKRGFDWVDVELRSGFLEVMLEKSGNGLIVSWHDLEGVPEDLEGLYARMCERGADVVKIAVTPRTFADVGRLVALAESASRRGGVPLVAIAMGPLGIFTRVLAGRYGAPFTYASAAAGFEAAPGQLEASVMADLFRVRDIGPDTKVYGVLGTDVARSLSPILHNRAFEARGLRAVYVPLQTDALEPFIRALPALRLSGFSVTRPFKTAILEHLHEIEEDAALCGSVNTVVIHDGLLQGSTTDGRGVTAPLRRLLDLQGRAVTIVGAGGAARAAALALHRKGARVTVLARDPGQARAIAAAVGCGWGDLGDGLAREYDVLVNATPVGSHACHDDTPVPAELLRPGAVVFDMVYDPLETRLLREATAAGCRTIGGLEMLIAQALAQFETWTGLEAPHEVMKSAALFLVQAEES